MHSMVGCTCWVMHRHQTDFTSCMNARGNCWALLTQEQPLPKNRSVFQDVIHVQLLFVVTTRWISGGIEARREHFRCLPLTVDAVSEVSCDSAHTYAWTIITLCTCCLICCSCFWRDCFVIWFKWTLSWAGTPRKPALKDFQVVVSIIIGERDMIYKLNVRNWRRIIEKPYCLHVLHSAVSSPDEWPTNWSLRR